MNSLRYFFVAVVLVGGAKLIEVGFYDVLKTPSKKDKQYHGEEDDKAGKEETKTEEAPNPFVEESAEPDTSRAETAEMVANETKEEVSDDSTTPEKEAAPPPPKKEEAEVAPANPAPVGDYFQELKNTYLSPILASLPEGRSREDIVIRYYRHEADGNKVYRLRSLGYYLHEREAEDNRGLGSNSLYYGSDVDIRDIQLVAFVLLDAGVPLKAITESQYDWKYNSLEIGADSLVENRAVLNRADIVALGN